MSDDGIVVRRGAAADLADVARIQGLSPEASQWEPADYLRHELLVALRNSRVAGFLVARTVAPGEHEVLNLAVEPAERRHGIARNLLATLISAYPGVIFLEVRESNRGARNLYKSMDFKEVGRRPEYYSDPSETAIVIKFHSC